MTGRPSGNNDGIRRVWYILRIEPSLIQALGLRKGLAACHLPNLVPRPSIPRFISSSLGERKIKIFLHGCEIKSECGRSGYEVKSHLKR